MTIEWFGETCVRLTTSDANIVIDPFGPASGLKSPKLSPDILLLTNGGTDTAGIAGQPFVIDGPGEYEVKKVFVYGLPVKRTNDERLTLYLVEVEGVSFAHLGNLGHQLSNGELERLEGVDVLFIPVGGHGVLNAEGAANVISAVEPRIVIPMQYKVPGLKKNLDSVASFAKELGVKDSETAAKFKLSSRDLPEDNMKVVILQP